MEYKIDVSKVIEDRFASITVKGAVDMEPMKVSGTKVVFNEPVSFDAVLTNVGAGILAEGRVGAKVTMACSRCLDDFEHVAGAKLSELYSFEPPSPDEDIEERQYHVMNMQIDLYPPIRDTVGLSLPLRPLHDEDCKGLCEVCGTNLNYEECEHHPRLEGEKEVDLGST